MGRGVHLPANKAVWGTIVSSPAGFGWSPNWPHFGAFSDWKSPFGDKNVPVLTILRKRISWIPRRMAWKAEEFCKKQDGWHDPCYSGCHITGQYFFVVGKDGQLRIFPGAWLKLLTSGLRSYCHASLIIYRLCTKFHKVPVVRTSEQKGGYNEFSRLDVYFYCYFRINLHIIWQIRNKMSVAVYF